MIRSALLLAAISSLMAPAGSLAGGPRFPSAHVGAARYGAGPIGASPDVQAQVVQCSAIAAASVLAIQADPAWARDGLHELTGAGVLSEAGATHADAIMTYNDAAVALSRLAKLLLNGSWHSRPSVPVSAQAITSLGATNWKTSPVTRAAFAAAAARVADYVANGTPRPAPGAHDLAQSSVLRPVTVPATASGPAKSALQYLAEHKLIHPKSPLLTGASKPLRGEPLSEILAYFIVGINNQLTPLNHDAQGGTPDAGFHERDKQRH